MKQFLKNIQTKLRDFWEAFRTEWVSFVIIFGFIGFGLYAGGLKINNFIIIITLFILYKLCVFIWSVFNKIKGFDIFFLQVVKVVQVLILLFFGLMFLDIFGYWFFKDYLGYNYFSWVDHFVFNKTQ